MKVAKDTMELDIGAKVKELQLSRDEAASLTNKHAMAHVELKDDIMRNKELSL